MSEQTNARDTQFRGFATAVWDELLGENRYIDISTGLTSELNPTDDLHRKYIDIIARRAYDLVQHTLQYVDDYELQESYIPDMTEFPIP